MNNLNVYTLNDRSLGFTENLRPLEELSLDYINRAQYFLKSYFEYLTQSIFGGQPVPFQLVYTDSWKIGVDNININSIPVESRKVFTYRNGLYILDIDIFTMQPYNWGISSSSIFRDSKIIKYQSDYYIENMLDDYKIDIYINELMMFKWGRSVIYMPKGHFSLYLDNTENKMNWYVLLSRDEWMSYKDTIKKYRNAYYNQAIEKKIQVLNPESLQYEEVTSCYLIPIPQQWKDSALFNETFYAPYYRSYREYITDNFIAEPFIYYFLDNEKPIVDAINLQQINKPALTGYVDDDTTEATLMWSGECIRQAIVNIDGQIIEWYEKAGWPGFRVDEKDCWKPIPNKPKQSNKSRRKKTVEVQVTKPDGEVKTETKTKWEYDPAIINYVDMEQETIMSNIDSSSAGQTSTAFVEDASQTVPDKSYIVREAQQKQVDIAGKPTSFFYNINPYLVAQIDEGKPEGCTLEELLKNVTLFSSEKIKDIIALNEKYHFLFFSNGVAFTQDLYQFDIQDNKFYPRYGVLDILSFYFDAAKTKNQQMVYYGLPIVDCNLVESATDMFDPVNYWLNNLRWSIIFYELLEQLFALLNLLGFTTGQKMAAFEAIDTGELVEVNKVDQTVTTYNKNPIKGQTPFHKKIKLSEIKTTTNGDFVEPEMDEFETEPIQAGMGNLSLILMALLATAILAYFFMGKKKKRRTYRRRSTTRRKTTTKPRTSTPSQSFKIKGGRLTVA